MKMFFAALAALLFATMPAIADAPPDGFGRRPVVAHRHHAPHYAPPVRRYGYGGPRYRHYGYRPVAAGPALGPLPPFFPGMGSEAGHLHHAPVGLTLYREAYIGRGLLYNTPPTLDVPGPGPYLSARY